MQNVDSINSILAAVDEINLKTKKRANSKDSIPTLNKELKILPNVDTLIQEDKTPYTPEEQLCIVLPKQSHKLLRQKKYLREEYYYPKETPLHMFLKRYLWECHPMLPL